MNAPGQQEATVSIEGLRAAFAVGTPTAVYMSLVPFLRQESKSTGDTQVINEISQSISQLVAGWLQTSQTMTQSEQHTLYRLLRPSGRLVDRLLQYHLMQRQQGNRELRIPVHALPAEFARASRLPAEIERRKSPTGIVVDAVEYLVFYVMRALGAVEGSQVTQWLAREYVGVFLPVAVPERPAASGADKAERSPIKQIRERLHDLGPAREEPEAQRPVDLLDMCEFEQASQLAGFVAASAVALWLPAVPPAALSARAANDWLWTPRASQLPGLRLFFLVVSQLARGERQLERHHLSGSTENARRVEMNGTLRDMLRSRCFNAAVCDLLAMALLGAADAELWVPALDVAVSIWLRYALPWRSSAEPASRGGISAIWQSRVPLMLKGMSPALYGPALSLFLRQISAPQVDLLAHTHLGLTRPTPRHGMQTWIHDAVSSVFGHPSLDVLTVIDRALSAFAAPELRAILEAVERSRSNAGRPAGPGDSLLPVTPTRQPAERPDGQAFELQVAAAQRLISPYRDTILRSGSPLLDYALSRPPKHMAFGPTRSLLLADCVRAFRGAEVLAERQLRLLAPESSADQARSLVADIFLVLHRLFSASDGGTWNGTLGTRESARFRVQSLHEAQASIRGLYAKLHVLGTSREIEAVKQAQDDAAISAQGGLQPFGTPAGFGQRLASRSRPANVASPEMHHGALTPRGRWELKTGRKKFTAQSLLPSPQRVQADAILPRGERWLVQARSYESQWLLDRVRLFDVWANRHFQLALNLVDEHVFPVPSGVRAYRLDFRWAAAYPNIRFAFVVLVVLRLLWWIFF
ncbi:hypothetical protein EV183_001092 [Coemansia sp. RSA 2336]|nr:hypothetical protein EV183_001092 [Coemansia sp. RSA 2336]